MDYSGDITTARGNVKTLSDRLAELEQMNQGFTKSGLDYLSEQKRPEGMSVIDFYTPRMNVGRLSGLAKENARANLESGQKILNDLFGLQESAESQAETKRHNLATEAADNKTGGLTVGPDGKPVITGEIDDVDANLMAVYEEKINLKDLTPTEMGKITARAQRYGITLPTKESQEKKRVVETMAGLKSAYYGGEGTEDDLALNTWPGRGTKIRNWLESGNYNTRASNYLDLRKGLVRKVMDFVGEKGIMTDVDANRLMSLLPDITASPEKAKEKWDFIEKAIEWKYSQPNAKDVRLPISEGEISGGKQPSTSGLDADDEALIKKYRK